MKNIIKKIADFICRLINALVKKELEVSKIETVQPEEKPIKFGPKKPCKVRKESVGIKKLKVTVKKAVIPKTVKNNKSESKN